MCLIINKNIYPCLIKQGANSNINTLTAAILNDSLHLITFFILIVFAHLAKSVCTICYIYWAIHVKDFFSKYDQTLNAKLNFL